VALSTALQVAVVHLPFLNLAFGTVPLSAGQWCVCVAMASGVLWFSEARKLLRRLWAARTITPSRAVMEWKSCPRSRQSAHRAHGGYLALNSTWSGLFATTRCGSHERDITGGTAP
jgi:hypothetical protein